MPEGSRYILFDPVTCTRTPVTTEVAETLSPEAQMFYRLLPLVVKNAAALFQFDTRGYQKNLIAIVVLGLMGTLLGTITPQATAILVNDAIPDSNRIQLLQIGLTLFAAAIGQAAFQMTQAILTLRVARFVMLTKFMLWRQGVWWSLVLMRNWSSLVGYFLVWWRDSWSDIKTQGEIPTS